MSICPKGKMSKSKRDKRKAQSWKISTPTLVACSKCGELMMPHRVCKSWWFLRQENCCYS